jgi:hypothetical protein
VTGALGFNDSPERAEHANGLYQGICDLHFAVVKVGSSLSLTSVSIAYQRLPGGSKEY